MVQTAREAKTFSSAELATVEMMSNSEPIKTGTILIMISPRNNLELSLCMLEWTLALSAGAPIARSIQRK